MIYWHKALCLDAVLLEKYRAQIDRLIAGEYKGTHLDLKKLQNYRLYTIRINDADRLLFTTIQKNGVNYLVLLEEILEHDYQKSRFLKPHVLQNFLENNAPKLDAIIDENNFADIPELPVKLGSDTEFKAVEFYNEKFLVLNEAQNQAVKSSLPMVVSGPAGSGKTTVAMRVLAQCAQQYADSELPILYVTESLHLKNNLKEIWDASPDKNNKVELKTYAELFGDVKLVGKEEFYKWFAPRKNDKKKVTAEVAYQEFRLLSACYTLDAYLALGEKQTQFLDIEKRKSIWEIYQKYLSYLKENQLFDPAFASLKLQNRYAAVVVDEAQDLSLHQLKELALAAEKRRVCYCMDSHQSLQDNRSKRPFLLQSLHVLTEQAANHVALPYSYRCPERVIQATVPLMAMKKRLTGRADKHEVLEILSAPGAELGNVHWVEPGKITADQVRRFDESKESAEFAVVTLPEFFEEASKRFRLVFTPDQIKGLEYKTIVAYRMFDAPIYAKINAGLKDNLVDEQFRKPINRVITAFTRAQTTLIIYQEKRHDIENLTRVIPHTEWLATEAIEPSSLKAWKKEETRQKEANNSRQAEVIAQKYSFSMDKFLAHNQRYFAAAVQELLKNPHALEILGLERTENNKNFFEAVDDKKWSFFVEKIKEYLKNNEVEKLCNQSLIKAERVLVSFGKSEKAMQLVALLRHEIFFQALALRNVEVIRNCLEAGFDPNSKDTDGTLPICAAADKGDKDLIMLLLKHGADINLYEGGKHNALSVAATHGDVALGRFLLDHHADMNGMPEKQYQCPMMMAIHNGHTHFVAMLLERGADPNMVIDGKTLLYIAVTTDKIDIVKLLAKHKGCELNKFTTDKKYNGATALHAAANKGSVEAVRVLVEAGCNMYAEDLEGVVPMNDAISGKHTEVVLYLISQKINLNHRERSGATALSVAITEGAYEITEILLKNGADVNPSDTNLNYLLGALLTNQPRFAELLFKHGADADRKSKLSVECLENIAKKYNAEQGMIEFIKARNSEDGFILISVKELAVLVGHIEILRILGAAAPAPATPATVAKEPTYLDKLLKQDNASFEKSLMNLFTHTNVVKILTEKKTQNGKNIFEAIDEAKWVIFIRVLKKYTIDMAAQNIIIAPIDSLIDSEDLNCHLGNSPNAKNFINAIVNRVFTVAMHKMDLKRIRSCLLRNPNPMFLSIGDMPTPLCIAANKKSLKLMQVLFEFNVDPNKANINGEAPIHLCCKNGFNEGLEFLLAHGADINIRGFNGNTPLQEAIAANELLTVIVLLKNGADVNTTNSQGVAALAAATFANSYEFVHILLNTKKCEVNKTDRQGYIPLHHAILKDNLKIVNALLDAGANPLAEATNGITPLNVSVGNLPIMKRLLEMGVDINHQDKNGFNPLLIAVDKQDIPALELLLTKKPDMEKTNLSGETSLAIAIQRGNEKIVDILLENGCDSQTPLTLSLKTLRAAMQCFGKSNKFTLFLKQQSITNTAETVSITPANLAYLFGRLEIFDKINAKQSALKVSP